MNIPINRIGKILEGEYTGHWIKVERLEESESSFLILHTADAEWNECWDGWAADEAGLVKYFDESGWVIAWEGQKGPGSN